MEMLVYDGSFEGFLSAVFYVYEYKLTALTIHRSEANTSSLFNKSIFVETDKQKALRVWKGLTKKLSKDGLHSLYCSYLADTLSEEQNMLKYIHSVLYSKQNIETNYASLAVMRIKEIEKKVHRERHRMKAFIRFQLLKENIYYANIEPDFNVIPLIKEHFEKRYADQRWIIYDTKRQYGIYYDLQKTDAITIDFNEPASANNKAILYLDDREELYQTLWQQYFKSVNIVGRKNMKLHIQHMPKRYWSYLVEKKTTDKEIL